MKISPYGVEIVDVLPSFAIQNLSICAIATVAITNSATLTINILFISCYYCLLPSERRNSEGVIPYIDLKFIVKLLTVVKPTA